MPTTAHTRRGFQRFCKFNSCSQSLSWLIHIQPRNPALPIAATVMGKAENVTQFEISVNDTIIIEYKTAIIFYIIN
jgi:hypothetical protein